MRSRAKVRHGRPARLLPAATLRALAANRAALRASGFVETLRGMRDTARAARAQTRGRGFALDSPEARLVFDLVAKWDRVAAMVGVPVDVLHRGTLIVWMLGQPEAAPMDGLAEEILAAIGAGECR